MDEIENDGFYTAYETEWQNPPSLLPNATFEFGDRQAREMGEFVAVLTVKRIPFRVKALIGGWLITILRNELMSLSVW